MANEPKVPAEIMQSLVDSIRAVNDDKNEEIEILVVAVKEGCSPHMLSTMPPCFVNQLLVWLVAHSGQVEMSVESIPTKQ